MRTWQLARPSRLASAAGIAAFSLGSLGSLVGLAGPAAAAPHLQAGGGQVHASTAGKVEVKTSKVGKYGKILVNGQGMALYYDTANKPPKHWACTRACLSLWPAVTLPKGQKTAVAAAGVSGLGTLDGPSGLQVTWHGKPLYTFAGDKAGQVNGEGAHGVWFVAGPSTTKPSVPKTTTTTAKKSYGGY